MGKLLRTLGIFAAFSATMVYAQELLGQLGSDGIKERESTTFSLDNDNATLIISSPIPNITLDLSRRNVIRSQEQEGRKIYVLPGGSDKITIRAKGYLPLEFEVFSFVKKKVYDLRLYEVRAPRRSSDIAGKGSIMITSDPSGAVVTLDGIPGEWTTPQRIPNILATTYSLTAVKEKYDTLVTSVTVVQKDTIVVPLTLVPRFGFLKFSVENGVAISLLNRSREFENYQTYELPRGEHTIVLQRPRYQTLRRTITIGNGDTLLVNTRLVPDFAYFDLTAIREGKVTIESDRAIGIYETKPGDHLLTLDHPEVGKLSKRFTVAPGATKKLNISDFQDPGDLKISSDVSAELYLNGKLASLGRSNQNLMAGRYTIKLRHPDLGEVERLVQLNGGDKKELFISMLPSRTTSQWLSLLPGASQYYIGNTSRSVIQSVLFAGGAAGAYYFYSDYSDRLTEYNDLISRYKGTTDPVVAEQLNIAIEAAYPDVQRSQYLQYGFFGLTAAVYLWNIFDAFTAEPDFGYRQYDEELSFDIRMNDAKQWTVGMQMKF
jgi:hypothetical protein